jgi:hypothetical protein
MRIMPGSSTQMSSSLGLKIFVASGYEIGIMPLSSVAGWSSLVARQAHNLKVAGSNPAPAPNFSINNLSQKKIISPRLQPTGL